MKAVDFEKVIDGKKVELFCLKNDRGMIVYLTNYGGRVVAMNVPDKAGKSVDVVLGFNSLEEYLNADESYHGAIVGRVGNRIKHGKFTLGNNEYQVPVNCGDHSLHGGIKGFHAVVWDVQFVSSKKVVLNYHSKDMEEGFPGNLTVQATFTLGTENELTILFEATTDKKTIVNLTHHNYFNLMGEGSGDILDQELQVFASKYTPLDASSVPSGELATVFNTPYDFTSRKPIGLEINADHPQTKLVGGYDHNFVLDQYKEGDKTPKLAAIAWAPNGIKMSILTNEPGLQFYTGNSLSGKDIGKKGSNYASRNAFCLEQQHFPDSPNQPTFPSTVLHAGESYYSIVIQKFEVES